MTKVASTTKTRIRMMHMKNDRNAINDEDEVNGEDYVNDEDDATDDDENE